MKKKRIRLNQNTLTLIGKPEHIHLLVNPNDQTIAICVCKDKDKDAIRIRYSSRDCEIYSKFLMERILKLSDRIQADKTYRITGYISENKKMITFRIDDAVCTETKGV